MLNICNYIERYNGNTFLSKALLLLLVVVFYLFKEYHFHLNIKKSH